MRVRAENRREEKKMTPVSKDLLWDIFSRLPIKSIIRCKCVCRYWRSLLQDPSFVEIHLNRCNQNKYITNIYFLSGKETVIASRNALALLDLDADIDHSDPSSRIAAATPSKVGQNLNDPHDHFSLDISSCNGLVCFSESRTRDPKLVCNPVTGQSISLPPPHTKLPRQRTVASGIGFDRATGQYKVVRILDRGRDPELARRIGAEIYSLLEGNGSWRDVGEVPSLRQARDRAGLFVDGELYWRMYYGNTPSILCMDIGREKFYTIQLPKMLTTASPLIDWKGCLGIVENIYGGTRFTNIWVLKDHHPIEEGKKKMSTWTKDISIEWDLSRESRQLLFINLGRPYNWYPLVFRPLGVQKNGNLFLTSPASSPFEGESSKQAETKLKERGEIDCYGDQVGIVVRNEDYPKTSSNGLILVENWVLTNLLLGRRRVDCPILLTTVDDCANILSFSVLWRSRGYSSAE